jgi:hypothetical protein
MLNGQIPFLGLWFSDFAQPITAIKKAKPITINFIPIPLCVTGGALIAQIHFTPLA